MNDQNIPYSLLELSGLRVLVRLGWTEAERAVLQPVDFDLAVRFQVLPKACDSDELKDTIGYQDLAHRIRKCCEKKPYKLIEHLNGEVYHELLQHLLPGAELWLRVTKVSPPLEGLRGGASFSMGAFPYRSQTGSQNG